VRYEVTEPLVIRPSVCVFVADAAPWEAIPDDGLPRHPQSRHARP
jgi:hypothetical protein